MKKLAMLFGDIGKVHLGKDVFLVPYYISKVFSLELDILTLESDENKNIEKVYRNTNFIKFKPVKVKRNKNYLIREFRIIKYLIKNAKCIDFLMMFHLSKKTTIYSLIYKTFNKKGKIYVKLDMSEGSLLSLKKMKNFRIRTNLTKIFFKLVDKYSIETKKLYNQFPNEFKEVKDIRKKLLYIPNGFDEEKLKEIGMKINTYEEKENIMIVVGRIGSLQKNNEMLLKVLDGVDLKNWKIYFLGPYTCEFKELYEKFISNNLDKKNKVLLKGNVEDKKELYSYYNKAKVFLHTSNYEGFALVFPEALRFGNYILSTNVGGAEDVTDFGKVGELVNIKDEKVFRDGLKRILDDKIDLKENYKKSIEIAENNFTWKKIILNSELSNLFI